MSQMWVRIEPSGLDGRDDCVGATENRAGDVALMGGIVLLNLGSRQEKETRRWWWVEPPLATNV